MKTKELKEKNKPELLTLAAALQIIGRRRMNKDELAAAIAKAAKKSAAPEKAKPKVKTATETRGRKTAATKISTTSKTRSRITAKKRAAKSVKAAPQSKKALTARKTQLKKKVSSPARRQEEIPDMQWQEDVERAKYELFIAPLTPESASRQELPAGYGETGITVMVRDPHRAFVYWEIEPQILDEAQQASGAEPGGIEIILRVYDITGIEFTGTNARHYFDIVVNARIGSWYLTLGAGDRTFCVEIGLKTTKGSFHVLARSSAVHTPRDWISEEIDEKYAATLEQFEAVNALSSGAGGTAGSWAVQEMAAQRLKEQVSSPGMSSGKQAGVPRKK